MRRPCTLEAAIKSGRSALAQQMHGRSQWGGGAQHGCGIRRALGPDPEVICSPGTYDQKHIDRIGKLKDCIAYGPGILDLAHQPDDYVSIDHMLAAAKVMALAAWSLLHRMPNRLPTTSR